MIVTQSLMPDTTWINITVCIIGKLSDYSFETDKRIASRSTFGEDSIVANHIPKNVIEVLQDPGKHQGLAYLHKPQTINQAFYV